VSEIDLHQPVSSKELFSTVGTCQSSQEYTVDMVDVAGIQSLRDIGLFDELDFIQWFMMFHKHEKCWKH
jgi:hypothetical protein